MTEDKIQKVAKAMGLTVEQVREVSKQAMGGTVTTRSPYSDEELEASRVEKDRRNAELERKWKSRLGVK